MNFQSCSVFQSSGIIGMHCHARLVLDLKGKVFQLFTTEYVSYVFLIHGLSCIEVYSFYTEFLSFFKNIKLCGILSNELSVLIIINIWFLSYIVLKKDNIYRLVCNETHIIYPLHLRDKYCLSIANDPLMCNWICFA